MKVYIAILALIGVIVLCDPTRATPVRVRRQGWTWGGEQPDRPIRPNPRPTQRPTHPPTQRPVPQPTDGDTAAGSTTTTTPSPQYTACVNACQTTPQYNPVCGSNRRTYDNLGKLNCAKRCGLNVDMLFNGTCSPLRRRK